jgi:hypothetical protein
VAPLISRLVLAASFLLFKGKLRSISVETRLLILNSDPIFQDKALAVFDSLRNLENRIVRTLPEAVHILLREEFDLLVVEGEPAVAIEQATNVRQHFPSLEIACLLNEPADASLREQASQQRIQLVLTDVSSWRLRRELRQILSAFEGKPGTSTEGIDPCHSLIGNLNQFSAAEILQMSCMSQRSGRFTFKSGRGSSEIYLHHGMVRHAVYNTLEGESAVAEIFRWRQGRFYFEEGIISQVQTVNRPWAHLLIDNLQRLDETMQQISVQQ